MLLLGMHCLLASLFLFSFLQSYSQLPSNIAFTNYNRSNGMPEENINSIVQDSRGFIWMGSSEGLIRFDGLNYKTWYADPADSNKFINNNVTVLGENKPGHIAFLSGAGLWQVNTYNQKVYQIPSLKSRHFVAFPVRVSTDKWCLLDFDSIYVTDNSFQTLFTIPLQKYYLADVYRAAFPLQYPYVYIYSFSDSPCYIFNLVTKNLSPITIDNSFLDSRVKQYTPLAYDSSLHRLYLAAYFNGVFYVDLKWPSQSFYQPVKIKTITDGSIRQIVKLKNQQLMLAGEHGLHITDSIKSVVFNSTSRLDKPMLSNIVLRILHSKDNNYWLATTNGAVRFNMGTPVVKYWRQEFGMNKTDEFKSILKGGDGNLYLLAQDKSLMQLNTHTGNIKRLDSSVAYCWSAISSGPDIIFTGAGKRLGVYNTSTQKIAYPSWLQPFYTNITDLVTLVFKAKNGDTWYSCNGAVGIIRNPAGTNQFIQYSRNLTPPSFSFSYVHTATEDKNGNIWWGSNKNGSLLKWDGSKQRFEEFSINELMPQYKLKTGINGLFADAADNLWIAMDAAGLVRYNLITKEGSYYDINKGMPADAVYAMANDDKNRLWFGTRKGLCCYFPEKDRLITFTSYDGFPEDDFEGSGIFFDKDEKKMYIGARQSVSFFNPDTLLQHIISSPVVYIDEMLVNGKGYYFTDEKKILLRTKENNIEFRFSSPDYNRNNQLIFQYQLKDGGNDWVDLADKRSITFSGLSHGRYTFSVRCKYKGTEIWYEAPNPFIFTIATPVTKTWWFRSIIALIAATLTWLAIRNYYRRKLEKQKIAAEKIQAVEKERTRIATDMHDDFGANLSRIKFISEKMQLTQGDNETLKKDLTKISDYSDEMAEKMNEIVWALNQRYDSCADLVSFCRAYASEFLQDKSIKLNFSVSDIPEKKIQGEVRRNTFLVMKEALHNIAKHSGAASASISFHFTPETMVLHIVDNGKGFEAGAIRPFANGLENMKKRITDINGNINITGNDGTSIRLTVPI